MAFAGIVAEPSVGVGIGPPAGLLLEKDLAQVRKHTLEFFREN